MSFGAGMDEVMALLCQRGWITYRTLLSAAELLRLRETAKAGLPLEAVGGYDGIF